MNDVTPRNRWSDIQALDIPRRREQLARTAERRRATIAAAEAFKARTGMSDAELARRIGYGASTLKKFLRDKYEQVGGDDTQITTALLRFFDECPVAAGPETSGRMYEIGNVRTVRDLLGRALEREHIFMLYGGPGAGKTAAVRWLIAEHNRKHGGDDKAPAIHYVYCRAAIRPLSLMRRIAAACGAGTGSDVDTILGNVMWAMRGRRAVFVLDEAQHLDLVCMETVRELMDMGGISLVFAGSHELDAIFRKFAGRIEQLNRRVTERVTLPAVTRDEARNIVRSELADLLPDLSDGEVAQQIEAATVAVESRGKRQTYISIGRLMAALRELRDGLAARQLSTGGNA